MLNFICIELTGIIQECQYLLQLRHRAPFPGSRGYDGREEVTANPLGWGVAEGTRAASPRPSSWESRKGFHKAGESQAQTHGLAPRVLAVGKQSGSFLLTNRQALRLLSFLSHFVLGQETTEDDTQTPTARVEKTRSHPSSECRRRHLLECIPQSSDRLEGPRSRIPLVARSSAPLCHGSMRFPEHQN